MHARKGMGRLRRLDFSAVLLITLWTAGCAGRIAAPPAPGVAGEPRASWIIRAGAQYGAEREICRSDRDQPCRLPASTDAQPISVVVSVFLYPAQGADTTYKGAFLSGFMGSSGAGHEVKVDYRIKPGERPSFVSAAGRVTPVPGDYQFRMALFANVPGSKDPHQFEQIIPVRVTGPRGA